MLSKRSRLSLSQLWRRYRIPNKSLSRIMNPCKVLANLTRVVPITTLSWPPFLREVLLSIQSRLPSFKASKMKDSLCLLVIHLKATAAVGIAGSLLLPRRPCSSKGSLWTPNTILWRIGDQPLQKRLNASAPFSPRRRLSTSLNWKRSRTINLSSLPRWIWRERLRTKTNSL